MNLSFKTGEELFQFLLIAILFVLAIVLLVMVLNIFKLVKKITQGDSVNAADAEEHSFWSGLTNAVPINKEETVMLHHNYDGIRELDNHLPPWWVGLFYGTVIFAVVYGLNYHVWNSSPLQEEEYNLEMANAKKEVEAFQAKQGESIDEKTVKLLTDASTIAKGKTIYTEKCVACHGANGEGGVGPNMTDEYWLHGGSIQDVFSTIKNGVPDKGMIAWKASLKPNQIQDVANYLLTLKGTNPANAKAAQGTFYVATEGAKATDMDSTKK